MSKRRLDESDNEEPRRTDGQDAVQFTQEPSRTDGQEAVQLMQGSRRQDAA